MLFTLMLSALDDVRPAMTATDAHRLIFQEPMLPLMKCDRRNGRGAKTDNRRQHLDAVPQ
jgi:hypothetical protein